MFDFYIPIAVVLGVAFLLSFCWFFRPGKTETVIAVATMLGQEPPPPPPVIQVQLLAQAQAQAQSQSQQSEKPKGLDQGTIDSYPRVVIGESGRMLKQGDDTCTICLTEYHINDTLKIMPECLHRFHVNCLDEWLRSNPTCPVCRVQPSPPKSSVP